MRYGGRAEISHNARVETETGRCFNKARTNSRNGGSIANRFNHPGGVITVVLLAIGADTGRGSCNRPGGIGQLHLDDPVTL